MKFSELLKKGIFALAALVLVNLAVAQEEEEPSFSISGSVDTYYRANLNGTNDPENGGTLAPGTSFANNPGFSLGMVNTVFAYEGEKVGFVGDLVFGPRGRDAVFGSEEEIFKTVNQLYVYLNVTDNFSLTLGNWNTFLGYEVISPTANFNYSTSYMFSYGPFSHSGLKANLTFGEGFNFMAAIMNPTDATDWNPTGEYLGGFQLGYSADAGGAWLNAIVGDGFYQIDLTTGWSLSDMIYLGLNATSSTDFYGAALYAQASLSDAFALGVRGEYFADDSGVVLTGGESVIDFTISAPYSVGNLTIIPEFRIDALSYDGFTLDASDVANPEIGSSLSSFLVAAVYAF